MVPSGRMRMTLVTVSLLLGVRWGAPAPNHPPAFVDEAPPEVSPGGTLTWSLRADDPDGDTLFFTARGLPPGATLDARTGRLEWYTGSRWWGYARPITVMVSDGASVDARVAVLQVRSAAGSNRRPVVRGPRRARVVAGCDLEIPLAASDPDGDDVYVRFQTVTSDLRIERGLPSGASWDRESGRLRWRPTREQAGRSFHVSAIVRDQVPDRVAWAAHTVSVAVEPPHEAEPVAQVPADELVGRWKVVERMDEVPTAVRFVRFLADGSARAEIVRYDAERDLAAARDDAFSWSVDLRPGDPQQGALTTRDHTGAHTTRLTRTGNRAVVESLLGGPGAVLRKCTDPECLAEPPVRPCATTGEWASMKQP